MGGAVWRGPMAGTLAQPQQSGGYSVTVRQGQELEPRKATLSGVDEELPQHPKEPTDVIDEADNQKNRYNCSNHSFAVA